MIFTETTLSGVFTIEMERLEDERGFFARTWCRHEFEAHDLSVSLAQCSVSFNKKRGTLRGMHYQIAPHAEAKLVRCTKGAIYDVVVDLRPGSQTFRQWIAVELTPETGQMIYIPEDCAHGFLTLEDNTEVFYQMSEFYAPECAKGVRWNDPVFNIAWPEDVAVISLRDNQHPDFRS